MGLNKDIFIILRGQQMQTQFSTISITIPKVKISMIQRNTFIYQMDVATRWGRWHLEKRYAEFLELHNKLDKEFDNLPEFPHSFLNMFMVQTEDQASEYQQILEPYMQQTSKRKDIINSEVYSQFLQLEKHSPMMLARKPKLLHQFQMEMRINDQGKVILDYFYDDNFIVFATGNDNYMQKFNSLVANSKMPWEQDQEVEYVLPLGTVECWLKKKENLEYKRVWARNYGIQTRSFIFSLTSMLMVVGLSDGAIQIFKLINKPRYVYYELPTMIQAHSDDVLDLFFDQVNKIVYSASSDGWINMIDANRSVIINKLQLACQITKFHADTTNRRLFVALAQGNIEIFEYQNARLKFLYSICTPAQNDIRTLLFDPVKNYLFSAVYETGQIFIFDIGKTKNERLSKQIGTLKNKQKIVDLIWKVQKMELLACTQSGQIFFWNTVKGEHIFMLKAFDNIEMSKCMYIKQKNLIITASRGRRTKFWEIPSTWRDAMAEVEQQREIEIRRKVQNMYKVREAVKRKQVNSDQDDLKGWHWNSSDQQEI